MDTSRISTVARVVVCGRTYRKSQLDNRDEARAMLLDAFASNSWPACVADFAMTPGGFVRARLPRNYAGARGWNSTKHDLRKLIPHAKAVIKAVACGDVLALPKERAPFLTFGVDLNIERRKEERIHDDHRRRPTCPLACTHAELVAVLDTTSGQVLHWTGKSYPVDEQQHTLVHATDLRSHLLRIGSERLLVLGCHDLQMFINRGRKSLHGPTPKEILRQEIGLASSWTLRLDNPPKVSAPRLFCAICPICRSCSLAAGSLNLTPRRPARASATNIVQLDVVHVLGGSESANPSLTTRPVPTTDPGGQSGSKWEG